MPAPSEGRTQILLVDDDEDTRLFLQLGLESEGFEVTGVATFVELSRLLDAGLAVDWVLLDLMLGDTQPEDVVAAVRTSPNAAAAKIVLVSGREDLSQRAKELGAVAKLQKPYPLQKLLAILRAPSS